MSFSEFRGSEEFQEIQDLNQAILEGIESTGIQSEIVFGFFSASSKLLSPTDHLIGYLKAGSKELLNCGIFFKDCVMRKNNLVS